MKLFNLINDFFIALGVFVMFFTIIGFVAYSEDERIFLCKEPVKFGRHIACMLWK